MKMRRKMLITVVLILLILLQSAFPLCKAVSAATSVSITLNSELYAAVIESLNEQAESLGITYSYSDANCTITMSSDDLAKVTYLDLSGDDTRAKITDLTGLDSFSSVTYLNLTGNALTEDSNLEVLNSLPLETLYLTSNNLESVSAIDLTGIKYDIQNQEVTTKEIIQVDTTDESDQVTKYTITLPDILLADGAISASWLSATVDSTGVTSTPVSIDWTSVNGNEFTLTVATSTTDDFYANKGLLTINVYVDDSTSKIYRTAMTLYYCVVDSDETGIIFNDENLYNAVKDQLTGGQTENSDLSSYNNKSKTLYLRAYDDPYILVIDNDVLLNDITSLMLSEKQITDLTGIEYFIGLHSSTEFDYDKNEGYDLDVSYNYIDTIEKVIELEENKIAKEKELQEKYAKYVASLSTNREALLAAEEKLKTLKDDLAKLREAENPSETDINNKLKEIADCQTEIDNYTELVYYYMEKLYNTYKTEFVMATILPASVVELSYTDLSGLNLSEAKTYAIAAMSEISALEQSNSLTSWETDILINYFGIDTTQTVTEDDGTETTVDIENPISNYFSVIEAKAESMSATEFKTLIKELKYIDSVITAGYYCYLENYYNGTSKEYYANDAFDALIDKLEVLELDTSFAEYAKTNYRSFASTCLCKSSADLVTVAGKFASVTSEDIELFVKIPRLKYVNMENNSVESLEGIETLTELKALNMYYNLLDDISDVDWAQMTKLEYLNLGYNQLSYVKCLEALTNLVKLDLSRNLISGSFNFQITALPYLTYADFSYNQISDIAYFINQFDFKAKGLIEAGTIKDVYEYILSSYCPTVLFQHQTLSLSTTVTQDGTGFVNISLPAIFAQAEKIDSTRTSFGLESLTGTVDSAGNYAKLTTSSTGTYNGKVVIDGDNGTGYTYTTSGIAYGTYCTIDYTVVAATVEDLDDTEDTDDNTDDNTGDNTEDNTEDNTDVTLEYGYTVSEVSDDYGYVYLYTPGVTLSTFANNVVTTEGYTVTVTNNSNVSEGTAVATGAVVVVYNNEGNIVKYLEVVVKGDVNGDGIVDALDSGAVKDEIYETASVALSGTYAEAADVNSDGVIDRLDSLLILQYRAELIDSFEDAE